MTADAPSLRLFVAIELPDGVRAALERTAEALRRAGIDREVRWVRPEGIHVTLKFLGPTPQPRLPEIERALSAAFAGARGLRLQPGELGSFGGRRNLRVVWVGVGGDTAALSALAGRVEAALAPLGFPTEQRPFAAHLTLARVRDETPPAERERIHDALQRLHVPDLPAIDVRAISLMQSELGRGGARYHALATFPLEGGHA